MSMTLPNCRFAQKPGHYLLTDKAVRLRLRLMTADDGPLLLEFLSRLAPADRRARFPASGGRPGPRQLRELMNLFPERCEHAFAFDCETGTLVATLLIACHARSHAAEVAISVAAEWKGRGIGRALLRHATERAYLKGARRLRALASPSDHDGFELERSLGFKLGRFSAEPDLVRMEATLA